MWLISSGEGFICPHLRLESQACLVCGSWTQNEPWWLRDVVDSRFRKQVFVISNGGVLVGIFFVGPRDTLLNAKNEVYL